MAECQHTVAPSLFSVSVVPEKELESLRERAESATRLATLCASILRFTAYPVALAHLDRADVETFVSFYDTLDRLRWPLDGRCSAAHGEYRCTHVVGHEDYGHRDAEAAVSWSDT